MSQLLSINVANIGQISCNNSQSVGDFSMVSGVM